MISRAIAMSIVPALAAATLSASVAEAAPDQLCLPDIGANEPAWWNPGLSPAKKESRWKGALVRKLGRNQHDVRVRSLFSPAAETAYFEIRVSGDPSLDPDADVVLLALGDEAGAYPELYIGFAPLQGCGNAAACTGAGAALDASAIQYSAASVVTSLSWTALSSENPSSSFVVDHPWVVVEETGGTFTWTLSFALVVPVDASGEIRPDLRIYGNPIAYAPGLTSGTYTELPVLCTSSSGTSDDCLVNLGPTSDLPGDLPTGNLASSWSVLRSGCPLIVP